MSLNWRWSEELKRTRLSYNCRWLKTLFFFGKHMKTHRLVEELFKFRRTFSLMENVLMWYRIREHRMWFNMRGSVLRTSIFFSVQQSFMHNLSRVSFLGCSATLQILAQGPLIGASNDEQRIVEYFKLPQGRVPFWALSCRKRMRRM